MSWNRGWVAKRSAAGLSLVVLVCMALGLPGCTKENGSEEAGPVVAAVGEREIKLREVTDPIIASSVNYDTPELELKARRRELDKLIQQKLLIIGAYTRALDADIGIVELIDREKDKFLLDELYRTQVLANVSVPESDVKAWYEHFFDRVRPKHIVVATKELADSILMQLNGGADFGDLAERYSIDKSTATRGGDLGREFYWGELVSPIQDELFRLKEGEVAGPVKSDFGWHIIKCVSRSEMQRAPYESVKTSIENRMKQKLVSKKRTEQLDGLRGQSNIRLRPEAMATMRQMLQSVMDTLKLAPGMFPNMPIEKLPDSGKTTILATYGRKGELTLYEVLTAFNGAPMESRPDLGNEDQVHEMVFQLGLFDLLRDQAIDLKLDQTQIYRDRLREFQESMMAEKMKKDIVSSRLRVDEADLRQFYDANPDSFVDPEAYHILEVLVHDEPSAIRIIREAQAGTPFDQLAKKYTVRSGYKNNGGDLGWVSRDAFPDLATTAATLKPGEVGGPVPGVNQYSAIKLLEVRPPVMRKYDDVKRDIFMKLQQFRGDSILHAFVDSIKVSHPVTINEDVLKQNLGMTAMPQSGGK